MKKYRFEFTGRQSAAIGITYKIFDTYEAKDLHEALSFLYEDYQTILGLQIWEKGDRHDTPIEVPEKINFVKVRSYTERERSPKTGTYKYNRYDAPEDYKF